MTLGTPVIATNAGGNPTLVADGETGLLVLPGNDASLEHALVVVAHDSSAARERAQTGQKRMSDFSVPHMLESTVELLKHSI